MSSTAEVTVSISQEKLAEQMMKAVLDRGLNSTLETSINQAFEAHKIKTIVENTIHAMLQTEVRNYLIADPKFKERVQRIVTEKLTDQYVDIVITKIIDGIQSRW